MYPRLSVQQGQGPPATARALQCIKATKWPEQCDRYSYLIPYYPSEYTVSCFDQTASLLVQHFLKFVTNEIV